MIGRVPDVHLVVVTAQEAGHRPEVAAAAGSRGVRPVDVRGALVPRIDQIAGAVAIDHERLATRESGRDVVGAERRGGGLGLGGDGPQRGHVPCRRAGKGNSDSPRSNAQPSPCPHHVPPAIQICRSRLDPEKRHAARSYTTIGSATRRNNVSETPHARTPTASSLSRRVRSRKPSVVLVRLACLFERDELVKRVG